MVMGEQVSEVAFQPMTLARLAGLLVNAEDERRYRLIVEFVEAYRWESAERRPALLVDRPATTGTSRWDVFLGVTAKRLAEQDGDPVPEWAADRSLQSFWFSTEPATGETSNRATAELPTPHTGRRDSATALFQRRSNSLTGPPDAR
jgi:hypothetical protein